jgi:hypothetical protein
MDKKEDEDFSPVAVVYTSFYNTNILQKPLYGNYQVNGTLLGRKREKEKKKEVKFIKRHVEKKKSFGSEIL